MTTAATLADDWVRDDGRRCPHFLKKLHPTILLVDDEPNDLFLLETAFAAAEVDARIQLTTGGRDAIDYLRGFGQYSDRAIYGLPDFIITDLKMPGVDGFAVLKFVRTNPHLATIPTVIFSGSSDNDDIKKSFWLGASSYHVKPSDPALLRSLVSALRDYWVTCEFPELRALPTLPVADTGFKLGDRFIAAPPSS